MASSFPGQGSVIRPYPGHARRAGGSENKVPDPPQGLRLSKFDGGNEGADLPQERVKLLGGKSALTGRISQLVVALVVVVGVVGDTLLVATSGLSHVSCR